jgi:spore germination cell wall hydrolase CwlJ-like protein
LASRIWTPAATRALIGVLLAGLFVGGAACIAGVQPSADRLHAQSLGRAAKAGYDAGASARPVPVVRSAPPAPPARNLSHAAAPHPVAVNRSELDCLAAAVYYEARGENLSGRAAVAQVVLNRVRRAAFPKSVCGVVYQGRRDGDCQFSFVCNGAMREPREPAAWIDARAVAGRALAGYVMTAVGKATFFHCVRGNSSHNGGVRLGSQVFFAT